MSPNYRFDATAAPDDIESALTEHGCAIVENVLDAATVAQLKAEILPHLAAIDGDGKNAFNGEFTKRRGQTMWLVPESRKVVLHPLAIEMAERTLLDVSPRYKLTFDGVMHVMAGQKAQIGHRDNVPWENDDQTPPVLFATLYALEDFRRDNGGTLFIPGSHLWDEDRHPTDDEVVALEMPAGSVLYYYGNLMHAAGESVADTRMALSFQYAASWLQQEEVQACCVPKDVLKTFDEPLLRLMGFQPVARNWGSVNGKHALDWVYEDGKERSLDEPGNAFNNGRCRSLKLRAGGIRTATGHFPLKPKK